MSKIQPVRGTHDLTGNDILLYKHIRKIISEMADSYDYNEIKKSKLLFLKVVNYLKSPLENILMSS